MMITETILKTIFNNLTTGVQPINKLAIAQQFNNCDGRGVHAMITQKIYKKTNPAAQDLVKMTYQTFMFGNQQGSSYDKRLEAKGLERSEKPNFNQDIPCTIEQLTALGVQDAKFGRFYYSPYTKVEDKELRKAVLNAVCDALGCKQKDIANRTTHVYNGVEYTINGGDSKNVYTKTILNSMDQVKIQYYLTEVDQVGYNKETLYYLNGKLTDANEINFADYETNTYSSNSDGVDNYRKQFLGNFLQIIPGASTI